MGAGFEAWAADRPAAGGNAGAEGEQEHRLGMLLRNAYFALRRCSNAHCASLGANGDQFVLLKLLADEGGVTQQDLVQRGGYDAATTGNMLRLMERRGLVERHVDPDDARAKRVHLTDRGRALQRKLWEHSARLRHALAESIPPGQRKSFEANLNRLIDAMQHVRAEYAAEDERPLGNRSEQGEST